MLYQPTDLCSSYMFFFEIVTELLVVITSDCLFCWSPWSSSPPVYNGPSKISFHFLKMYSQWKLKGLTILMSCTHFASCLLRSVSTTGIEPVTIHKRPNSKLFTKIKSQILVNCKPRSCPLFITVPQVSPSKNSWNHIYDLKNIILVC
jgi:hypothetical protein